MIVTVINKSESVIYDGKIYGYAETFEIDSIIGKSLIERGYVATADKEESQEIPSMENVITEQNETADLNDLSYSELKRIAAEKGLSATGKKTDLIDRILSAENAEGTTDDLPDTSMPE